MSSNYSLFSALDSEHARLVTVRASGKATTCRACGHYVRSYERKIRKSTARWFLELAKRNAQRPTEWQSSSELSESIGYKAGGEFSILKHWDLIEQRIDPKTMKRSSGMWRCTIAGLNFARGVYSIRKTVSIYRDVPEWTTGEHVWIWDLLEEGEYQEIWSHGS